MKTVAPLLLALLPTASALRKVLTEGGKLDENGQRELMSFVSRKTIAECEALIQADVEANPALFEDRASLNYVEHKVREDTDNSYFKVGLRTNAQETGVAGILGDGMIFYPWDWCYPDENGDGTPECRQIGPWDCDVGTPLTVEQCCNMIKASVPNADVNGNYLECYASYPVGSVSNPVDYGRVTLQVNKDGIVVRPPRNE
eukprot:scaffold2159_cov200-Alexandrium_tamarense.AAC.5